MTKNILFILLLSVLFSAGCLKDKTLKVDDNTSRVITEFIDGDSNHTSYTGNDCEQWHAGS